jgi:hypothetical protein
MITQVNRLIFNTLCKGSDVTLPNVGSLVVRRSSATKDKGGFVPPKRTVTFTGESRGVNIVELIASTANVDNNRAEEIYNQWLLHVGGKETLVIESVGKIANRKFTADDMLLSQLNPLVAATVAPKAKKSNKGLVIALVAILIAIAAVAIYLFIGREKPEPVVVAPEPVVEVAPEPEPEPQSVKEEGVERMVEGGNYLVWGVFAQKQNAMSYKKMLERKYPELNCTIYHHREDTMYLLAVCDKPTRTACLHYMWSLQEKDGLFDDMWIFTNK